MKAYGGMDVWIHIFLTSVLVWGELLASRLGRFNPGGKSPRDLLDRRLGGPQNRSGRRGEMKILDPTGTRNSGPSVVQLPARLSSDQNSAVGWRWWLIVRLFNDVEWKATSLRPNVR
jgi:hypothetical protein